MLEGMTALGFMAAHTKRARLGLMVGGIHYRNPGMWVKATTTLDVLSGGRAWLGIGAAWNRRSRARSASRSRRSACASRCSRRRSRSPTRCSRASAASEAAFHGRHYQADAAAQLARSRSRGRASRSWSAAAASGRRSASSPSTPTRATSSARPEAHRPQVRDPRRALRGRRARPATRSSGRRSRTSASGRRARPRTETPGSRSSTASASWPTPAPSTSSSSSGTSTNRTGSRPLGRDVLPAPARQLTRLHPS